MCEHGPILADFPLVENAFGAWFLFHCCYFVSGLTLYMCVLNEIQF